MEWLILGVVALLFFANKAGVEIMSTLTKAEFLAKVSSAAIDVSHETGIPLSIIVTQAAHESNYGNSQLAQKSNNLFGIKASAGWIGPVDSYPTHENVNGKDITVQADFRKYSTWEGSVRDWLKFIQGPRYAKAYAAALKGDSKGFFTELQRAGYATDPNYANELVGVLKSIETELA